MSINPVNGAYMKNTNILAYVVGIIIILLAAWMVTSNPFSSPSSHTQQNSVFVSITDPPHVPSGTTSLVITYNSIALHEAGKSNSTGFLNINQTGSINLMNVTNSSETIAKIAVSANQSFDMVRFSIVSATITIGNQTYNVTVPNGKLQVKLNQELTANASQSGVLLQLNPSVLQIYAGNQTFFVMVPAAKAVVLNSSATAQAGLSIGQKSSLDHSETEKLNGISAINITSAKISASGGHDLISVTVKNTGNKSIVLKHLFVRGFITANAVANISEHTIIRVTQQRSALFGNVDTADNMDINRSGISNISTTDLGINQTYIAANLGLFNRTVMVGNVLIKLNASNIASVEAKLGINGSSSISDIAEKFNISRNSYENGTIQIKGSENEMNRSIMEDLHNYNVSNTSLKAKLVGAANFRDNFFNMLNFIIATNGTLSLPYSYAGLESESEGSNGYTLAQGSAVTLTFNGTIALPGIRELVGHAETSTDANASANVSANASVNISKYNIQPIVNQTYTVTVIGDDGAYARANVTAS